MKRENKLWNNDTLFLREFILIPVTPDNESLTDPLTTVTINDRLSPSTSNGSGDFTQRGGGASPSGDGAPGGPVCSPTSERDKEAEKKSENPLDFLNKYDSNIAKLKSDVAKMKTNAE